MKDTFYVQHKIIKKQPLLKEDGTLTEEGWSTKLLLEYDRSKIKAPWWRIKEWDYYYILDAEKNYGLTCTMADMGYVGLFAVVWLDFKEKKYTQLEKLILLPRRKIGFASDSSSGITSFRSKKLSITYNYALPTRKITISAPSFQCFDGEKGLEAEIELTQAKDLESMVIATSWKENRKAFYYNQKINCMPAKGTVSIGTKRYTFTPESSMGGFDWGRGRWTYKNRWYWGSASGRLDNVPFGWNIGYGFSDRTPASENMIFYDGKAHKLDQVTIQMDSSDYLKPWRFTSNDDRFEMSFEPLVDRRSNVNFLFIKSIQHQVFGHCTGQVTLNDGTKLKVDKFLCLLEDFVNWG